MSDKKKYKAEDLVALIKKRFSDPQRYVVCEQVANGTGAGASSWVDAAVFSLWPSDGLLRQAFEVKVDRRDFINEVQSLSKNAWARECFHMFWFVTAPGVAEAIDIPEGCGLMQPHGGGLSIKLVAQRKKDPGLDDSVLASFMRSAVKAKKGFEAMATRQMLESDLEYRVARAAKTAVTRLLSGEIGLHYCEDSDKIYAALLAHTSDDRARADRDHVLRVLETFQGKMINLLELMCYLAGDTLLAVDEAGHHVVKTWGGDVPDVETLKKKIKKGVGTSRRTLREKLAELQFANKLIAEIVDRKE